MKPTLLLGLLALLHVVSYGATEKKQVSSKKTQKTIQVDGQLTDDIWKDANWTGDFQMYYPYDNKKASERTEFAVVYDKDFIYVGIKAYDSEPESIVKRITRRDDIDGDWVSIQFDSYHDLQTAYEFKVSAAGTKEDKYISGDGDNHDESWDPIWWVKTSSTENGWEAEMKIPFSQFRFVNTYEQTWGLQLERFLYRLEEMSTWQPVKRDDPGWVHHFGHMDGIVDIQPRKVFDLIPYAVGSIDSYKKEEGNPYRDGSDLNGSLGLDGKIGLTNNITLDFTVNPDFGQVEADPSTVNLTAFELFFEEKRPFFIEGKSIISFPLLFGDGDLANENLFYSRRVGRQPNYYPDLNDNEYSTQPDFTRILAAAKITGRTEKGLSIGVSQSFTAKENAEIYNAEGNTLDQTVEPFTNYSVVSMEQDFGNGNTLLKGMITSTNRSINDEHLEFMHRNAYSGGLDFTKFWKDKTWLFQVKGSYSYIDGTKEAIAETQNSSVHLFQRPDADYLTLDSNRTSLEGFSSTALIGKVGGGRWNFVGSVSGKTPGYNINDVGFLRKADEVFQLIWVGYRVNEPFSVFRSMGINFNQWASFDFGGNFLGIAGNINGHTSFKNYWDLSMGVNISGTETSNSMLRGGPGYKLPGHWNYWIWAGSDGRKNFRITGNTGISKGFENYYQSNWYNLNFTLKPSKSIQISLRPSYRVRTSEQQYVASAETSTNDQYILGTIDQKTLLMSLRLGVNLTPDLSIQYWGQPFFATGEYNEFKRVTNPKSDDYSSRYVAIADNRLSYNATDELYTVDENGDGVSDYEFSDPNFNSKAFLSNLVLRWEYSPGSTLYVVWSQNRNDFELDPTYSFNHNLEHLFDFKPHDTFLVKLSYRIGL